MGQRSRNDRPGHQQRAKGRPTPEAPDQRGAKTAPPTREEDAQMEAARAAGIGNPDAEVPPTMVVAFAVGATVQTGEHPALPDEPLLDLVYIVPGGQVIIRTPAEAWPAIRAAGDAAYEEAGSPGAEPSKTAGGLVTAPAGTNLAAEAQAAQKIRNGGTD